VLDGEPINVDATKNAWWVSRAVSGLSVTRIDVVNLVTVELDGAFGIFANAVPITDEDSHVHSYDKTQKGSLMHLNVFYKFHGLTRTTSTWSARPTTRTTPT